MNLRQALSLYRNSRAQKREITPKSVRGVSRNNREFWGQGRAMILHSSELVDVIFSQPYCRIGNLVDAGIAKRQTASVYLKKLVEIGVLREIRVGREKLFVNPKLIGVITTSNDFRDYS